MEDHLKETHLNYKGCPYNVMIEWETRKTSREPLKIIATDNSVTCAIYDKNKNFTRNKRVEKI